MKFVLPIISILFAGCNATGKYPEVGYSYPKNIDAEDTNLYYYPIKDIEPARDAFWDSYNYLFYAPFGEPNMSIKPLPQETFRLTYSQALGKNIIIILTENLLTIKQGDPSELYEDDTLRLTEIEKYNLQLLRNKYPIDTAGKAPLLKNYLDSMIKLYPQLLNPAYYHLLVEKSFRIKDEKFIYQVKKIAVSKKQYSALIKEINAAD